MNPCEINAIIMAITNHFFVTLTTDEFICLSIFLNELSKSMFATTLFKDLCAKNQCKGKNNDKSKDAKEEKDTKEDTQAEEKKK